MGQKASTVKQKQPRRIRPKQHKPPKVSQTITAKEVAVHLRVSPETVNYLRTHEKLPFIMDGKYILFSEPEILRWRNKRLSEDSKHVLNLKRFHISTGLYKFISYDKFYKRVQKVSFVDGDHLVQYIPRQSPDKNLHDLVGDIVAEYWNKALPKCKKCGRKIHSDSTSGLCYSCLNALSFN